MYKREMSPNEISEIIGLNSVTIREHLLISGIKMRTYSEAQKIAVKKRRKIIGSGNTHIAWKGGISITKSGYNRINNLNGNVYFEHRHIWEKMYGEIPKNWAVHHLNGIKTDNRIENLQAMPRKLHSPRLIIKPYQERIKDLERELKKWKN